jgi:uncharacterized protein
VFEIAGKRHVFDPSSGRFFRADRAASEIVPLIRSHSEDEIRNILAPCHPHNRIESSIGEVRAQISEGNLYPGESPARPRPELAPIAPRIVSVTLNVASICNLDCVYCWNRGGAYGRDEKQKLMDRETAIAAVDLAAQNGFEKGDILVDFYGGEPLLNFDVIKATMEHCKKIEKSNGGGRTFSYKVTTNGTILTDEMVDFFGSMGITLGVSIDGSKKVHNRNRPFPGGGKSWDIIRRNVEKAVNSNRIHVSARATLVPPDISMVKATKSLFREGFYDTEVEFASEASEAFKPGGKPIYSEEEDEAMKREYLKFAKFYLGYTLHNDEAIDIGISNNITRVLHETDRFSPCGAGSNFITISEDGTIYPCIGFVGMPEYILGTVKDGFDLDSLAGFRHSMRCVIYEAEECADCWARYICKGNCPANNEQHNRDFNKPYQRGCEWLKYKLEVAMWVASEIGLKNPSRLDGYRPI